MNTIFKTTLLSLAMVTAFGGLSATQAQTPTYSSATQASQINQNFVKKRYSIKGSWSVDKNGDQTVISFSDDFKTKGGPDLKVYLSSHSIEELESGAVETSSKKISVLKSNRGAQSYIIPEDINLSEYKSVVIHCEAFSVLWGGFDIVDLP